MADDALVSPKQLAVEVGCTLSTLARWRHAGAGPAFSKPNPKRVIYRRSDINAWYEKTRRTFTAQEAPC